MNFIGFRDMGRIGRGRLGHVVPGRSGVESGRGRVTPRGLNEGGDLGGCDLRGGGLGGVSKRGMKGDVVFTQIGASATRTVE